MTAKPLTENEAELIGGRIANPHPDGQPWDKCCGTKGDSDCMCFTRKPKFAQSRYSQMKAGGADSFAYNPQRVSTVIKSTEAEGGRFFCMHRTDGDFHRECAGWAALKEKP